MEEVDVPSYFLCPISLQLMRDPVTVSSGITYDRENIEKWLFSSKKKDMICPVTKQALLDNDLTPNHTLRRLIQSWCTLNASNGIERIPTPKPTIDKTQIIKLLDEADKFPHMQFQCLRRLRSIVHRGEWSKKCLEAAGAVEFLASIIKKDELEVIDEALQILCNLEISENISDGELVESLVKILKYGHYQSRAYATMALKSVFRVSDPIQLTSLDREFFIQIVSVLRDQISQQASKSALKLLIELCPWGRNRIKAVEGGAVEVLIELLLDTSERRYSELALVLLEQLCGCAEGRAELLKHGGGVAVVSKKILRVSHMASDKAVKILSSVCRFSATSRVLQEMLQVGVVNKLCVVLEVDGSLKTRERAREILKLHSAVWRNSPCIPAHLLSSFPSS